jgi:hypothetical protein
MRKPAAPLQWLPAPTIEAPRPQHILSGSNVAGRPNVLGNSLTVEQRTLTPSVLVRIQVPQPNKINTL